LTQGRQGINLVARVLGSSRPAAAPAIGIVDAISNVDRWRAKYRRAEWMAPHRGTVSLLRIFAAHASREIQLAS
jgi:hypothetical protein